MRNGRATRVLRLAGAVAIFAVGFLCGSLTQRSADAQLGEAMRRAAGSGALGPAGELGTAIVDMEQHVSGLQRNLDSLKKVKTALGG
jgi:hypothetical protein